ncbi:FAD binding domain protein [Thozetella sp. PMI_491]|nr:FAD binding domain protein [Thozetella sp. PMI_491]
MFASILISSALISHALSQSICKVTPSDALWPSAAEWSGLNCSIGGVLLATQPVGASCYADNSFRSPYSCDDVNTNWAYSAFHAATPESIDYPFFANNTCVPPSATGYDADKLCTLGGLPAYVVNATSEQQIATAVRWADQRNIRIVIKGTGHDLNGRSAGAHSLSIWTRNLNKIEFKSQWQIPSGGVSDVFVVGSGVNWGAVTLAGAAVGKVVVSGQDETVGLGGFIQAGGHGPMSSHYGLSADNIYQATVVTIAGEILVANDIQHQELLWVIRGGGPGLWGVVTEFVLKAHPMPENVVSSTLSMSPNTNVSTAVADSWNGLAAMLASLPDLMDNGLTGSGFGSSSDLGAKISISFFGYNTTVGNVRALLEPVKQRVLDQGHNLTLSAAVSQPQTSTYMDLFNSLNSVPSGAGAASLISSRLLGRAALSELPLDQLASNLQQVMASQSGKGSTLIVGLQGGRGPAEVEESRRGALNPAWRIGYVHTMVTGINIDLTKAPQDALAEAAAWAEENKESVWRMWTPETGAYINEANGFDKNFKADFYGANYDRLLALKNKYDPNGSLYVLSGVGSDLWDYNLTTGRLCRQDV